jgi:DNA-binding transcriptional LysR family regulator
MIKRSHIRQFLAVVDMGSFTRAAQHIRVTQPALSTGVADLERLVGAPLFIRSRHQIRLTEAGGRFLPIARDLERGFRAADGFGRVDEGAKPLLRLGTIRSVPGEFFQTVAALLARDFTIEISEDNESGLRAGVHGGRLQMAVVPLRPGEREPHVVPLYDEPFVMFVAADHPLAGRGEVGPEELAPETMIARRSCEFLDATSRFFTHHRVRPRFALRSDSDDRCLRLVAAGVGITTAPVSLAIDGIVPLKVSGYDLRREIGLLLDPRWLALAGSDHGFARALPAIRRAAADWRMTRVECR